MTPPLATVPGSRRSYQNEDFEFDLHIANPDPVYRGRKNRAISGAPLP
jgi:hypothetical protein